MIKENYENDIDDPLCTSVMANFAILLRRLRSHILTIGSFSQIFSHLCNVVPGCLCADLLCSGYVYRDAPCHIVMGPCMPKLSMHALLGCVVADLQPSPSSQVTLFESMILHL